MSILKEDSFTKIRAHHLLCLQGFQGHGYSSEFIHNISRIIHFLKSDPEYKIEITTKYDEICKFCPHNKNNTCKNILSNLMIKKIDEKIIKKLNISLGSKIAAKHIFKLTNYHFKTKEDIKGICGGCSWKGKCLWYLKKKAIII